jgi:primary-amine oxidase
MTPTSIRPWLARVLLLVLSLDLLLVTSSPAPKSAWLRNTVRRKGQLQNEKRQAPADETCADKLVGALNAPKTNVWWGISDFEAATVTQWLFAQDALNLTVWENAIEWDNSILLVELMIPNKTDVLVYIDGNMTEPTRYAHVILDNRAMESPVYVDMLVGPLPVKNGTTTYEPLNYPYTKAGGQVRNLDADSSKLYAEWLYPINASISDIILDLWNGSCAGLVNDSIDVWGIDPLWQDDGQIIRWDTYWNYPTSNQVDAETLLPLGLYFMSEVTGRDPSKRELEGWLYANVFYPTTEAFRAAYYTPLASSNTLPMCKVPGRVLINKGKSFHKTQSILQLSSPQQVLGIK